MEDWDYINLIEDILLVVEVNKYSEEDIYAIIKEDDMTYMPWKEFKNKFSEDFYSRRALDDEYFDERIEPDVRYMATHHFRIVLNDGAWIHHGVCDIELGDLIRPIDINNCKYGIDYITQIGA